MGSFFSSSSSPPSSRASTSPFISGASSLVPTLTIRTEPIHLPEPVQPSSLLKTIVVFLKNFLWPAPPEYSSDKQPKPTRTSTPRARGRADKFPFVDFVSLVHNASLSHRALPVTAIETYHMGGEKAGAVPHRYSVVTILHPHGYSTYLKLQLQVFQPNPKSILTAELADDRSSLIRSCDRRLAALELAPQHADGGPSLDALAKLLDVIQKRAGRYDPYSRNCLWLADLVFFASAMKFKDLWLAKGRVFPDRPIKNYMHGKIEVLAASNQCFVDEGAPGFLGVVGVTLLRMFGGLDVQREVEEVVGAWRGYVEGVPQADFRTCKTKPG